MYYYFMSNREDFLAHYHKRSNGAYLRVRGQGQVEQGLKASADPGKPKV